MQSLHRDGERVASSSPCTGMAAAPAFLYPSSTVINPTCKLLEILRCGTEHLIEYVISLGPHSGKEQPLGLTPELPDLAAHPLMFSFSFSVTRRPRAHTFLLASLFQTLQVA